MPARKEYIYVTNLAALNNPEDSRSGTMGPPRKLKCCVKCCAGVLLVALVVLIVTGLSAPKRISNFMKLTQTSQLFDFHDKTFRLEDIFFDDDKRLLVLYNTDNKEYLKIGLTIFSELGDTQKVVLKSTEISSHGECSGAYKVKDLKSKQVLCLEFSDGFFGILGEDDNNVTSCYTVQWLLNSLNATPTAGVEQCFDLQENWYGGGALSEHRWPLNRVTVPMQPYITRQFNAGNYRNTAPHFESFLEPYFLSANGIAIILDDYLPLYLSINSDSSKQMCMRSQFDKPYSLQKSNYQTLMKYKVCKGHTARDIHERLLKNKDLSHPLSAPDTDILQKPVWSTRGIDLKNIDERELLKYIQNLKVSGLPFSQLILDGNYSRTPGSVYFNEKKFPHSSQLIMELGEALPHQKLKVATEIYPVLPNHTLLNNLSMSTNTISDGELFLDLSNENAVEWFESHLKVIVSQVGVKGFRFSGGHAASPLQHLTNRMAGLGAKTLHHPNQITHKYGKIARHFQGSSFLGSGYKSQSYGLIADSGPFLSNWEHRKGLKSLIPTVITYGIMGYPFVSVGPIGGVDYRLNSSSGQFSLPDRNLFIRWAQLSSFLPVMEFSVGPWHYDNNLVNYTRHLMTYRQDVIWPKYLSPAIEEAMEQGIPIIRPLWWIAPFDETAQFIDCEFMVGNKLLVAPVLYAQQQQRQVYLPQGAWWKDCLRGGKLHEGGKWLQEYEVEDFEIAHFERVSYFSRHIDNVS